MHALFSCKQAMANGGQHLDGVNIQVKDETDTAMVPVRKRAPEPDSGEVEEHGGDGHVPSTGQLSEALRSLTCQGLGENPRQLLHRSG